MPTSKVTAAAGEGAENTHAPPGNAIVLVAATSGSAETAAVVTGVDGTVLLGVPSGGSDCVAVEPSSTLHPAASRATPITTHPKRFITCNGRSLVTGWPMMPAVRNAIVACALIAGCSTGADATRASDPVTVPAVTSTDVALPQSTVEVTTTAATTTTTPRPLLYVFPFAGTKVSYSRRHHDYPATDVFGCGASVVAPIGGTIQQTRVVDPWVSETDDPATRGGKYVSMLGDDGVRYYFAHLESVDVQRGDVVDAGAPLGVMGQTGNARKSACHTHFGISWPCDGIEWAVRRGEIWPWKYLDAWRKGEQLSPVDEVAASEVENSNACNLARAATSAADA